MQAAHPTTKLYILILISILFTWGSAPEARADGPVQLFMLLASEAGSQATAESAIDAGGGHITHTFPREALIATVSPQQIPQLQELPASLALFTQAVDLPTMDVYGPKARFLGSIWNSLIAPPAQEQELNAAEHPQDHQDMFMLPDLPGLDDISISDTGVTPGYYDTSEYMAGSVAVGIVLVESDGTAEPSTEDWTSGEIQQVFTELVNGLNWWADLEPAANLSFVYDDHFTNPLPTSIEPINNYQYKEGQWIGDAMDGLGFSSANYFYQVFEYNNQLRNTYQTDWAFTIFVVDSSNDTDNKFRDGYFAYAYLGGPFLVLTYGNNGYGPSNMDAVAAHEVGHIFNALDQYSGAYQDCSNRSGYLRIENQNSRYSKDGSGCSSNETSIMRGQIYPYSANVIDPYAAGQLGWRDSDGDGIFDPLDTNVPVTIDAVVEDTWGVTLQGTAHIEPYPSPTGSSFTINTLTGVQYRLDGGPWQTVGAAAAGFGGTSAGYSFSITTPGQHTVEVAALDSAGNVSDEHAVTQVTVGDPDGGLNTELSSLNNQSGTEPFITVNGVAYHLQNGTVTGVEYRLDDGPWRPAAAKDGTFDSSSENFAVTLTPDESAQSHLLEARAIDQTGHTEVNTASLEVEPVQRTYSIFLPAIIRE